MRRTGLSFVVLAAMSMSIAEFVELQKLGADDLRARFGLPSACEPAVTAATTDPQANSVTVAVECRGASGAPPPAAAPRPRQKPSTPAGRGS